MTSFGKNMRITVGEQHRSLTRQVFTEVLGCSMKSPAPDLEVYGFEDGFGLGAYYVPAAQALDGEEHLKAPWLELCVADPEQTQRRLGELGIHPFDYADKAHAYYRTPGGPVFRLARRA